MDIEHEVEALVTRLAGIVDKDAYRKKLHEEFLVLVDLLERSSPDEAHRVLLWAIDNLSTPAASALLELISLTWDFTLGLWLPQANTVTDAMTACLLTTAILENESDMEQLRKSFDASPLLRPLRYGFRIPKGVHIAIEGFFLTPLVFDLENLVHFVRYRKYVAGAIQRLPFVGCVPPWDEWTRLEARYGAGEEEHREFARSGGQIALLGCVPVTLFGPMDTLTDLSSRECDPGELGELEEKLSVCLGPPAQGNVSLYNGLVRPSEMPYLIDDLVALLEES